MDLTTWILAAAALALLPAALVLSCAARAYLRRRESWRSWAASGLLLLLASPALLDALLDLAGGLPRP